MFSSATSKSDPCLVNGFQKPIKKDTEIYKEEIDVENLHVLVYDCPLTVEDLRA